MPQCLAEWGEDTAEDRDEYIAENIFWVPPDARWPRSSGTTPCSRTCCPRITPGPLWTSSVSAS